MKLKNNHVIFGSWSNFNKIRQVLKKKGRQIIIGSKPKLVNQNGDEWSIKDNEAWISLPVEKM